MLYVVHTMPDMLSRSFKTHAAAFQEFRAAVKRSKTVALWHCDAKGKWTKVHDAGLYPATLTEPYMNLYDSHNKGAA